MSLFSVFNGFKFQLILLDNWLISIKINILGEYGGFNMVRVKTIKNQIYTWQGFFGSWNWFKHFKRFSQDLSVSVEN